MNRYSLTLIVLFFVALSLSGFGCNGGGGESFSGTAYVRVSAEPSEIDIGDSVFVDIKVDDFKKDSFFLKIRFPAGLRYIPTSSFLRISGKDVERDPNLNFTNTQENKTYLVYFISKSELDNSDNTRVTFDLVGDERISKGDIEVDADIDDPNVANDIEFDPADPQFDKEDASEVQVR
jgi:hypothetical protein